ncbi:MAG: VWA domain-containing protein [Bacteroidaceae bacterium]|nr:VWA domain-containing protein [Bacteroidaceae bacterium]
MFRFENTTYLYLLILLPILVGIFEWSNIIRRKRIREYGDPSLLEALMPDTSNLRFNLKFWLCFAALFFLIIVAARPQFGTKSETIKRQGIETVIALDISNSMLAEDVAPNRLEKSKKIISKMVDEMEDDKIGLIVFAGDAFIQLPITSDFISAKMFLESISPNLISRQGTDIKTALNLATRSFTQREDVGRAIIVITDGENHEGGAEEAAKAAAEKGMQVFVLGVGSAEGSPIPGNNANEYRKDKDGNVIVTQLNEQMCQEIAKAGNGAYIRVDNTNASQKLLKKELDKLAKADQETTVYSDFDEQFRIVAWLALITLILEMLVSLRKNPLFKNIKLFE